MEYFGSILAIFGIPEDKDCVGGFSKGALDLLSLQLAGQMCVCFQLEAIFLLHFLIQLLVLGYNP